MFLGNITRNDVRRGRITGPRLDSRRTRVCCIKGVKRMNVSFGNACCAIGGEHGSRDVRDDGRLNGRRMRSDGHRGDSV